MTKGLNSESWKFAADSGKVNKSLDAILFDCIIYAHRKSNFTN